MDQESRKAPRRDQQITEGLKQEANASYRGRYVFGGTADGPPVQAGATDTYGGDTQLIDRQVGPALPCRSTSRRHDPRQGGADGKLLARAAQRRGCT
jgi:hypothetical protein